VVTAGQDGSAVVWRMDNGRRLGGFSERWPLKKAWGSESSGLVLLTGRSGRAAIWDARTRRRVAELGRHGGEAIDYAEFGPDGRYLVTGRIGKPTRVWRVASGVQVSVLGGERREAYGAGLSADGRFVVNAEASGVRVYETASGHPGRALPGRTGGQADPVFSRDGTTLAINSAFKRRLQVFDWASRRLITELARPVDIAVLEDRGAYLATAAGRTVRVWEARTGARVGKFTVPGRLTLLGLSGDARVLLAGQLKGLVRLIECEVCRSRVALLALAQARGARALRAEERQRYLHE
jgi:WD40 repeat protein